MYNVQILKFSAWEQLMNWCRYLWKAMLHLFQLNSHILSTSLGNPWPAPQRIWYLRTRERIQGKVTFWYYQVFPTSCYNRPATLKVITRIVHNWVSESYICFSCSLSPWCAEIPKRKKPARTALWNYCLIYQTLNASSSFSRLKWEKILAFHPRKSENVHSNHQLDIGHR